MTIDVVPVYLSCTTKLLSKCTESLISSIHKALSQPQDTHHQQQQRGLVHPGGKSSQQY